VAAAAAAAPVAAVADDFDDGIIVKEEPPSEAELARYAEQEREREEANKKKRRKKMPKGFITQIEWKRGLEATPNHPLSGSTFADPNASKKVVLAAGAPSILRRTEAMVVDQVVREDAELPVNIAFDKQIDALYDPDLTDSDDEDPALKKARAKYERSGPVFPMNAHKLRQVFSRSYTASRGIRASLFATRIGEYCRQLSKKAQSVDGEPPEASYTVIFENCFDLRYESHYREPGKSSGPLEEWIQVGALLPIFDLDCFGHMFIADIRVWVSYRH
jgi:hypothetical protein